MKDIKTTINEASNAQYRVQFLNGVNATIILDDPRDARKFDKFLEDELDNTIIHADGGPNDIEL